MASDESGREELARGLESKLGPRTAELLMEHLPPVAWADLATKKDLEAHELATKKDLEVLEHKLLGEIHRATRQLALTLTTVFGVFNGVVFTALKLS